MAKTLDEILDVMHARRQEQESQVRAWIKVRDRYNGTPADFSLPIYRNEDRQDNFDPMVPAFIAETIDRTALEAASVSPMVRVPAVDAAKDVGVRSREYAMLRKAAIQYVWDESAENLLLRRAYRHLAAYATTSLYVSWNYRLERPVVQVRDPLTTYPDPRAAEDYRQCEDVGYITGRSATWLRQMFPAVRSEMGGPVDAYERMWDVFEWIDEDSIVTGVMGPRFFDNSLQAAENASLRGAHGFELSRARNHSGMVPAVVPRRITLDRVLAQIQNQIPTVDAYVQFLRAQAYAVEKNIEPDTVIFSNSDVPARLANEGGEWKRGVDGEVNIVTNAAGVQQLYSTPDPSGVQLMDRLERNFRISVGSPALGSGDPNSGALRTGRAISQFQQATSDPRIQELHEIMANSLQHLNSGVLATWKGYGSGRSYKFYSARSTDEQVEFRPSTHVETLHNKVSYPIPGLGVQNMNIALLQMAGAEMMSNESIREMHPWVTNPDLEATRVAAERSERAILAGLEQQMATGQVPLVLGAEMVEEFRMHPNTPVSQSIVAVNRRIQEEQARREAEAAREAAQGQNPIGAQPGLQPGAEGVSVDVPPAVVGPTEGADQLRQLSNALSAGNRTL